MFDTVTGMIQIKSLRVGRAPELPHLLSDLEEDEGEMKGKRQPFSIGSVSRKMKRRPELLRSPPAKKSSFHLHAELVEDQQRFPLNEFAFSHIVLEIKTHLWF